MNNPNSPNRIVRDVFQRFIREVLSSNSTLKVQQY